jgi:hypothetical protein
MPEAHPRPIIGIVSPLPRWERVRVRVRVMVLGSGRDFGLASFLKEYTKVKSTMTILRTPLKLS